MPYTDGAIDQAWRAVQEIKAQEKPKLRTPPKGRGFLLRAYHVRYGVCSYVDISIMRGVNLNKIQAYVAIDPIKPTPNL